MISDVFTLFFNQIAEDEGCVANFCWTGVNSGNLNGLKFGDYLFYNVERREVFEKCHGN